VSESIQVSFASDSDDFISQQCPSCARRFKAKVDDKNDHAVNFCPYCGSQSDNAWMTEEQQAYVFGLVSEQFVDPMLDEFTRDLERMNRPGGLISVSGHYEKTVPPPKPVEPNNPMPVFTSPCCGEAVKHDGFSPHLFCVVCGKEAPTSTTSEF
jgi:hypothetical protein